MAVLPPRHYLSDCLAILLPNSPFILATQTILTLVPHPQDANPASANSRRLRSAASEALGIETFALVEHMLQTGQSSIECVQALAMLSLWEWGHTSNTTRNRARSGQAIQVAMEMGMHELDKHNRAKVVEGVDWFKDMMRRTWWTTYVAQLTSAIVTGTSPIVGADDPRIQVNYPICSVNDSSWSNWVETVKSCSRCMDLVNVVVTRQNQALSAWGNRPDAANSAELHELRNQMMETDRMVQDMMKEAERTSIIELVPGGEEEVARNQQLAVRFGLAVCHIHIHRHQAFPEVSLFSKQICGLPKAPDFTEMPLLNDVALPQALADGDAPSYSETPQYQATFGYDASQINSYDLTGDQYSNPEYDFIDDMWIPEAYPDNLPMPWFTQPGGAAALYAPVHVLPNHLPTFEASIAPISPSDRRSSIASSTPGKLHKAWGVDVNVVKDSDLNASSSQLFPPGISLARCATAAHTIVRLEVLHRSASMALWDGP
jgi:hypothetical protein